MNLLIFSRPGVRIFHELRKSETAWHALRFYDPIEIPVGIFVPVSSLSAALSLASDLKYFIRKLGVDHLFLEKTGVCYTAAVAKSRYHTRDALPEPWPWKLWYWVSGEGTIFRYEHLPENEESGQKAIQGGFLYNVLCSEEEYSVYRYTRSDS